MDTHLMRSRNLDSSDIPHDAMAYARKQAIAKKARLLAEQAIGIGEDGVAVVKGPMPIEDEEMVTLTLDMYPGAGDLRLDGKIYRHGQTVTVGRRVADTMLEIVARGWKHQEEIDGKTSNAYYKPSRLNILSGKLANA